MNCRKAFEMFFLKEGKRLSNLKYFTHKIDHFVQGHDMLSTRRLSQTLIHPKRLLPLLRKVVSDVTMKNSQFISLYTDLYHYYETHSVSFTNTEYYLDKDTYDGKESKYTRLHLKQNQLEYSDLDQPQLNSCLKLHTDYICPNLRLTVSTHVL